MSHRSLPRLLAILASGVLLACGGDKSPSGPDPDNSSTVTLTVSLTPGVVGTPSSSTPAARGTSVSYAYNSLPGYTNLVVTLDGSPVAAAGTVTMDRSHTLSARATAP